MRECTYYVNQPYLQYDSKGATSCIKQHIFLITTD